MIRDRLSPRRAPASARRTVTSVPVLQGLCPVAPRATAQRARADKALECERRAERGAANAVNPSDKSSVSSSVTRILESFGDQKEAREELLPLVYEHLHAMARQRMQRERGDHTLQATALVSEAYMRLVQRDDLSWQSRGSFFAAAAEAMRRILIDHARQKKSLKRGEGRAAVPLTSIELAADGDPDQLLALDEALTKLEAEDERAAHVVRLRFFAGLSVEETAAASDLSVRTVMREWAFARARLFELLQDEEA